MKAAKYNFAPVICTILGSLVLAGSILAGLRPTTTATPAQVAERWIVLEMPRVKAGSNASYLLDTPVEISVESTSEQTWSAKVEGHQTLFTERDSLRSYLKEKRATLFAAQVKPERIQVFLRPTRDTRYQHMIEVYDATRDADLGRFAFMMSEPGNAKSGTGAKDVDEAIKLPASTWGRKIDVANSVALTVWPKRVAMTSPDGRSTETYKVPEREGDRTTPSPALAKALRSYASEDGSSIVIIRADRNTLYRDIEPILVVCAQARVARYAFAVQDDGR